MTIAKLISYCIALAMTIVIYWAQTQVSILDSTIPQLPWGVVSLVDPVSYTHLRAHETS